MAVLKNRMSSEEWRAYMKSVETAKASKYKAIPAEAADGQKFRSHLEMTFYNRMKLMLHQGDLVKLDREVRFELNVNGFMVCAYICDFILTWKDGTVEHIDCKSQATKTPVYVIKKKLMEACHGIILKEVYK